MTKIRYLRIEFANALRDYELLYFRSAVIEATDRAHDRFHNHNAAAGSLYRYPLIQYRTRQGRASLVCLHEGVDDIHFLLQRRDLQLRIGAREDNFVIQEVKLEQYQVQCWDRLFSYHLQHWLPLNSQNYARYQALPSDADRHRELERILTGNLLSFCKGIGYWADQPVKVQIDQVLHSRFLRFKDHPHLGFSLSFRTNLSLPPYVGLGKGASVGFGGVREIVDEVGTKSSDDLDKVA